MMGTVWLGVGSPTAHAQTDADPITGWLTSYGELESLATALVTIGLADSLSDCSSEPVTVLAPTDTAFQSIAGELGVELDELLADATSLEQILTRHVVEGPATVDELLANEYTPTLHGDEVEVFADEDLVILDGYATMLDPDLVACNGIVHVIDSVLVPADFDLAPTPVDDGTGGAEGETEGASADDDDLRTPFIVLSILTLGAGIGMVTVANRRRPS